MAALVEKERLSKLKKIRNIDTDLRLVQWLDMHKTDPYPTKLEKKWLACDSGKTVGQIEGWFSNAAVHKITTYWEKGEGPSLLGRNWLSAIKLDWQQIFKVEVNCTLQGVLSCFSEVFKEELGTVQGMKARIHVNPQPSPIFL